MDVGADGGDKYCGLATLQPTQHSRLTFTVWVDLYCLVSEPMDKSQLYSTGPNNKGSLFHIETGAYGVYLYLCS